MPAHVTAPGRSALLLPSRDMRECRHFVPELGRELSVVVDSGELDAYRQQFASAFPVPEQFRYLLGGPVPHRLVDIGANVGCVSFFAAALGMSVLAIEALAENFLLLSRGILANGFSRVLPCHAAASNDSALLRFAGYWAWGHVPADPAQLPTTPVPSLPADDLLTLYGFADVDLIKIDVEGHELQVLEGLEKTLKRSRPVLVVESNTWTRRRFADYEAPLEFLRSRDYALFMFVGGSVKDDEDYHLQELCVADYFCVPRERIGSVPAPARIPLSPEERVALMAGELQYGEAHAWHVAHMIERFEERFPGVASVEVLKAGIIGNPRFVQVLRGHSTPAPGWMGSGGDPSSGSL